MGRRIEPPGTASGLGTLGADTSTSGDPYHMRLLKLIPAESSGAFIALSELAHNAPTGARVAEWIVFALILICTPIFLARQTRAPGKGVAWLQVGASTGAFLVWAYTIGGPFKQFSWYEPYWGSLAMIVATFLLPLVITNQAAES
jgi:hypothetical protein